MTDHEKAIEAAYRAATAASNFNYDGFNEETKAKYRRQTDAAITAYLAALGEAGSVVVPVNASPTMIDAGVLAWRDIWHGGASVRRSILFDAYRAMLAARPRIAEAKE